MFTNQLFGYNKKEVNNFMTESHNLEKTLRGDIEFLKQENERLKAQCEKAEAKKKKEKKTV